MKKFLAAVLCAGLIAVAASGCGYSDPLAKTPDTTQSASAGEQSETQKIIKDTDYKNNLGGLVDYFAAKKYINNDEKSVTKMDAASIGAKEGKKFANTYNGKNITIELYEYNTDNLNNTAKSILDSVKTKGTFSIYDLPDVPAYISDNGKFLMVYTDASIDKENPDKTQDNYIHREEVITDFTAFHK